LTSRQWGTGDLLTTNEFRFGVVAAPVNSRISAAALTRISYLSAAASRADSFWLTDHLNALVPRSIATPEYLAGTSVVPDVDAFLEPWTMLGNFAARNRFGRLRLGICVTDTSRRNPAVTAQAAATLHLLTRGRAILGIGVGEREANEPYGVDMSRPVTRFEEGVATIRALWESGGKLVSRESPYFPLRDAVFALPPYRGKWPEIWIAAHGPRMLRATGRYADGWLPLMHGRPADYATALECVRAAASDAGRDPMSVTAGLFRGIVTAPTRDQVDEALSSVVAQSIALAAPADIWARHGVAHPLGPDFSGAQDLIPQTISKEDVLSYASRVPRSLMDEMTLNGTPSEVLDQVAEWRDHGVRYLVVFNGSVAQPRIRGIARSISPYARLLRGLRRL
jgi:phthiodiolone/phenolphthiodiolone dimycocerosates ketoreductase